MLPAARQSKIGSRTFPANGECAAPRPIQGAVGRPLGREAPARNDWLIWQLADSAFPTGGFAHSNGLEAAWQNGAIRNAAGLAAWTEASMTQIGHGSLPFMTACHHEPRRFSELDRLSDCFILNHVANRASRLQGRALMAAARGIFGVPASVFLPQGPGLEPPYGHFAPAFGALSRALGFECESAARLFLFLHLRGAVASAVRLGIVGPTDAQALQHRLGGRCESWLPRFLSLRIADIAQTAPLLEIWQGTQDRLYSRLFQS